MMINVRVQVLLFCSCASSGLILRELNYTEVEVDKEVSWKSPGKPVKPTLCTEENQGRCVCGNLNGTPNARTFTWWIKSEQRCYTIFDPSPSGRRQQEAAKLPVVMHLSCYDEDDLSSASRQVFGAELYNVYLVYASSPRGEWSWTGKAVWDNKKPWTCGATETTGGIDYTYFEDIFSSLEIVLTDGDLEQVFTHGFSQNGVGAHYVGSCFQDKVLGAWQGGSGLSVKGTLDGLDKETWCATGPIPPKGIPGVYFPMYPCFPGVGRTPLRQCVQNYDNDPYNAYNATVNHAMGLFNTGLLEGADVRALVFKSDPASGVEGGHMPPANEFHWAMGCLGLRNKQGKCSKECVTAFMACTGTTSRSNSTLFQTCFASQPSEEVQQHCYTTGPGKYGTACTPTWEMLMTSEAPDLHTTQEDGFGAPHVCATKTPSTSMCTVPENQATRSCHSKEFKTNTLLYGLLMGACCLVLIAGLFVAKSFWLPR